ncbi:hypothetical protein LB561_09860 [Mesorhizobium sp. B292B1B]|uniref:hypothetical protein n=1 Tax=unclassified Mesorhizobium TaxID=325217 RepID=UPI001129ADE4|nr:MULTISPECIES: hypothetical protein [unclassified Mesorhizobium]MCA0012902.1 hypothetical protein [Mesorhizobium sp. B294B1A1]MCA0037597.1 hypothetical protein [Mesorhizobium sp. B292B1B]TPM50703.1 hypothetical protein FJ964_03025 [Mesorhizobium sp. B2-3-2]
MTENEDWTPEAEAAIGLCQDWARDVTAAIPCTVYLFGSAIYQGGDQFDVQRSDLDLVVVFHEDLDASERVERLQQLQLFKVGLELRMVPSLHRTNCEEPGVSVVPVSSVELEANIHKSGARRFFDKNIFLDLSTGEQSLGLPGAGLGILPDENRQALEYVQKVRNQFLAISANQTGGIAPFDGPDPLPKSLARVAAQLSPDAREGEWYDTRIGLEYLSAELSRRRSESDAFRTLYRKISIRRGGRGQRPALSNADQLLLAELLYDVAAKTPLEPVATWQIRFEGTPPTEAERSRLAEELRRLVPDAQILGIFVGSIIIRVRSSKRSYGIVRRFQELGMLSFFFAVETVQISPPSDPREPMGFEGIGPIERIAAWIRDWRPQSKESLVTTEASLAGWLNQLFVRDPALSDATMSRMAAVGDGASADFLLRLGTRVPDALLAIELVRLRNRSSFFSQLEHVLHFRVPTILVVVGTDQQIGGLREDINRLAQLNATVRVVTVALDNG